MIGVSRGLLRLRESAAGVVSDGFERLTRRPFPRLRPRPLWYEQPLYYKGNPATFIGDGDTVRWPAYAQALDYELEIGVVIARDGSDLTPEEALAVVGGFVLVDGTVYFSDSSTRFRIEHYKQDMLEHRPNGRIFRYRPPADLDLVADGPAAARRATLRARRAPGRRRTDHAVAARPLRGLPRDRRRTPARRLAVPRQPVRDGGRPGARPGLRPRT